MSYLVALRSLSLLMPRMTWAEVACMCITSDEPAVRAATKSLGVDEKFWPILAVAVLMRPYRGANVRASYFV